MQLATAGFAAQYGSIIVAGDWIKYTSSQPLTKAGSIAAVSGKGFNPGRDRLDSGGFPMRDSIHYAVNQ